MIDNRSVFYAPPGQFHGPGLDSPTLIESVAAASPSQRFFFALKGDTHG